MLTSRFIAFRAVWLQHSKVIFFIKFDTCDVLRLRFLHMSTCVFSVCPTYVELAGGIIHILRYRQSPKSYRVQKDFFIRVYSILPVLVSYLKMLFADIHQNWFLASLIEIVWIHVLYRWVQLSFWQSGSWTRQVICVFSTMTRSLIPSPFSIYWRRKTAGLGFTGIQSVRTRWRGCIIFFNNVQSILGFLSWNTSIGNYHCPEKTSIKTDNLQCFVHTLNCSNFVL